MTFSVSRTDMDASFLEVRSFLSFIKLSESTVTPPIDSDEVKVMRGLFYVHLYGAFERSITDSVTSFLRATIDLDLRVPHLVPGFLPLALDGKFKSLQASAGGGSWKKRTALVDAMVSDSACIINDSILSDQLMNVWPQTLKDVSTYLGVGVPDLPETDLFALREVVDKRNQVAHGRTNPLRVGANVKSPMLESRFTSLSNLLDRFIFHLEDGFNSLHYVKPEFHEQYRATTA